MRLKLTRLRNLTGRPLTPPVVLTRKCIYVLHVNSVIQERDKF